MMKIASTIFALILLLSHFACKNTASPLDEDFSHISDPHERWQAYKLSSYSIEQRRVCFCAHPHGFVQLAIENGKIVKGVENENSNNVPENQLRAYQTVEELFDWIEQEMARNPAPATLDVEYHPKYGFPTSMTYDLSTGIADDELWLEMQKLEVND